MRFKREKGFTLIELMLVIAIIAAITVVGISAYRQQSINFQTDKTALQLQQWLQAGQAYYQDCSEWPAVPVNPTDPDGLRQLMGQEPNCKGVKINYMPVNSNVGGPFGNTYDLERDAENPQKPGDKLFRIVTTIPVSYSQTLAHSLAQRIAGHLPLATLDDPDTGRIITAQVGTITGGEGVQPPVMIMSITYVDSGNSVTKPTCKGKLAYPHLYLLPVRFRNSDGSYIMGQGRASSIGGISAPKNPTAADWISAKLTVSTGTAGVDYAGSDNTLLAITTCEATPQGGAGLEGLQGLAGLPKLLPANGTSINSNFKF